MIRTAGGTAPGSRPLHILAPDPDHHGLERPVCGANEYAVVSLRADLVTLDRRCAADGCYQAWPVTDTEQAFTAALTSPWGRRSAGRTTP
jgi:hypothetical protein